jgi:hypothetical protein
MRVVETTLATMPDDIGNRNHEQDLPAPFIRRCVITIMNSLIRRDAEIVRSSLTPM